MQRTMDTAEAEAVAMTFGKFRGETLGNIAHHDLLYLDWLNGVEIRDKQIMLAVAAICAARFREIAQLIEEREEQHVR